LLQLIFTLLHCSFYEDRKQFLKNILQDLKVSHELSLLTRLSILNIEDEIILDFFTIIDNVDLSFSLFAQVKALKNKISNLIQSQAIAKSLQGKILSLSQVSETPVLEEIFNFSINRMIDTLSEAPDLVSTITGMMQLMSVMPRQQILENIVIEIDNEVLKNNNLISEISEKSTVASNFLKRENLDFVCTYESRENQTGALLFCIHGNTKEDIESFTERISKKVFLAAPSTQIFIFTSRESQQLLFKGDNQAKVYHSLVKGLETDLPGLFTYDFLSVDLLIDAFKSARDQDFSAAVTFGKYGNSYQTLIGDLNLMLGNKKINISPDLSEIIFKLSSSSGDEIDLYPENLSHGELKRLSLYMWLRSRLIEDSIVLMDEVEIAFHPDWQYQIVSDLAHWAPSNQYILATHSYELCQAVTPAHVKELEPKLLKTES
jgi:AAA domain, putative AbiEii toxin, Type IV TA system